MPDLVPTQIRWATFNDITTATAANLIENPVNVNVAGYEQPLARSHNVNIAFQRDIGFSTVAEIAYVGNFTEDHGRTVDVNRLPLNVFGNPDNLVNNAPLNTNALRAKYGQYPGMGSVPSSCQISTRSLRYHALQMQVQRRLSKGLQMGMAYTLAKGEGFTATTRTPTRSVAKRRSGRATGDRQRRPPAQPDGQLQLRRPIVLQQPVVKQLLSDWQISGVTKLLSGQAITPSCTSNNPGRQQQRPSLTEGTGTDVDDVRCELTGEPLFVPYTGDPNIPECGSAALQPGGVPHASADGTSATSATPRSESCATRRGMSGTSRCPGASRSI